MAATLFTLNFFSVIGSNMMKYTIFQKLGRHETKTSLTNNTKTKLMMSLSTKFTGKPQQKKKYTLYFTKV